MRSQLLNVTSRSIVNVRPAASASTVLKVVGQRRRVADRASAQPKATPASAANAPALAAPAKAHSWPAAEPPGGTAGRVKTVPTAAVPVPPGSAAAGVAGAPAAGVPASGVPASGLVAP